MTATSPLSRLRIPIALAVLAAGVLVWNWAVRDAPFQSRVVTSGAVLLFGGVAVFVWSQLPSSFAPGTRRAIGLAALIVPALAVLLFEIKGVDGDLVPIVGWRWFERTVPEERGADDALASLPLPTHDWPQFLGPTGDARMEHVDLATDWEAHPPRLLWRRPVGAGWSGFAVRGFDAITSEQDGAHEATVCYDVRDGSERWRHRTPARFESVLAGDGPRATPTVTETRVFAIGATGILSCLDRATGAELWRRDLIAENGGRLLEWGWSASPLVLGDRVVVNAGGTDGRALVAYDAETGSVAWTAGDEVHSFSSPQFSVLDGAEQIVTFHWGRVTGRAPMDGALLWSFPWPDEQPSVAQPVVIGADRLVTSGGYGMGAELHRIRRDGKGAWSVEQLWRSRSLKAKFACFVVANGALFGMDDGILASVDVESGRRNWKGPRYGHGQLILVAGHLLVLTEAGDVALVATDPLEFREVARFHALDGKSWNCPALAPPYLLVRNDTEAACFQLAPNATPSDSTPKETR